MGLLSKLRVMHLRLALIGLALACCVLVACANTTGGGTTMPGGQLPNLAIPATSTPAPTPTPNSATGNIVVVGDGNPQTLQAPGDFKVTAIFPKSTGSPSPVTLNVTVSVPGPPGIDAYGSAGKPKNGVFGKSHKGLSPAVLYVWFESDKDKTLASLPTLDFAIPLSVLDQYGTDPIIGLAIYDPAGEVKWVENVAQRGNPTPTPTPSGGATAAVTPTPSLTATPTPTPTPTATPSRPPGAPVGPLNSPTIAPTPAGSATPRPPVPSQIVRFTPAQRTMKLLAKKNLVLVLYAEPQPTPTPTASGKAAKPAASASAGASAEPSSAGSSSAAASPSSAGSATPASSASPAST